MFHTPNINKTGLHPCRRSPFLGLMFAIEITIFRTFAKILIQIIMTYNLLKGKKGLIFGALNEQSIAWKVAERAVEEGAEIVLTNTAVSIRMGTIGKLAEKCNRYSGRCHKCRRPRKSYRQDNGTFRRQVRFYASLYRHVAQRS